MTNRKVGDCDTFFGFNSELKGFGDDCPGAMDCFFGGEYRKVCFACGVPSTARQYLNCCCDECGARFQEIFEYFCESCEHCVISERFIIDDLAGKCTHSFSGIGFPLIEVGDIEFFIQSLLANVRRS